MKNNRVKAIATRRIPPPPDLEDGYDAIIAYHKKYSLEELEEAGYIEDASPEHVRDVAASATYELLCRRGLNLKLSRKDYEQLSCLAAAQDVAAEDLGKKWIRERLRAESKPRAKQKR
jgi:hypothetical protein